MKIKNMKLLGLGLIMAGILSGCGDKYKASNFVIDENPENDWVISSSKKEERLYTVEYIESPEKKIRINSRILFNFNESNLLDNGKKTLDGIVDKVKGQRIQIVGHTDELGSKEYNFRLGKERADAARSYLISKGLDGSLIYALSAGESLPLVTCKIPTKECLAPNRRVEIIFDEITPEKKGSKTIRERR